ncbi:MAG: rhomboid family intramembrane serine protease [Pseudomonadota bacterium]
MFPLNDNNPTHGQPWVVYVIIGLNLIVWFAVQGMGTEPALGRSMCLHALIPGDLLELVRSGTQIPVSAELSCVLDGERDTKTLVSSMFMHGGWLHLIGNLWFLYVFGDNIEDALGPLRFAGFYLLCGIAASAAQIATNPGSTVPMVGASGAIGGVMGAYALLYPRARINTVIFLGFFVTTIAVPAVVMLGYWFALQLLGGLPALGRSGGGVAFWAHIGGFLAGLALVLPLRRSPTAAARHPNQGKRWF